MFCNRFTGIRLFLENSTPLAITLGSPSLEIVFNVHAVYSQVAINGPTNWMPYWGEKKEEFHDILIKNTRALF